VTSFESDEGFFDTVPTSSVLNIKIFHPLVRVASRRRVRAQRACDSSRFVSGFDRVLVSEGAGYFDHPRSDEMILIDSAR
jgi:hypothetical protein